MPHDLQASLAAYRPYNEQEQRDLPLLLAALKQPDSFTRQNETAHFTASAWVVNPARDKVLMIYHNIYNSWSWTGGHADGETDLLAVALREVAEETGLQTLRPVSRELFSVEILTVDGHEKRGRYVPSHLHLNCTYLIEADDTEPLRVKPDENSGVRWFAPREALAACTDYHAIGVIIICALYLTRADRKRQCLVGALLFLFELTAPLAFVLVWFYNGQRGACSPLQKKAFYWFYPVHLLVLAGITNLLL